MMMRRTGLFLTGLLLVGGLPGCLTHFDGAAREETALDPVTIPWEVHRIIERDALLIDEARDEVMAVTRAELDGKAPEELIIHTRRTLPGFESQTLWFYDLSRPDNPRQIPMGPRMSSRLEWGFGGLGGADHRTHRIEDIDGDGRAEILLAGGLRAPIMSLLAVEDHPDGSRVVDRLWRDPNGFDAVPADVDGDGRRELVSILVPFSPSTSSPGSVVVLKPDAQGWWREIEVAPELALPATLEALVLARATVSVGLPTVAALMRQRGLAPRDVDRLQRGLEAQLSAWRRSQPLERELEWIATTMAWLDSPRAYEALLPIVGSTATDEVAAALLELDERTGQSHGREALLKELDLLLDGAASERGMLPDSRASRLVALLEVFQRWKIDDGVERLARAFETGRIGFGPVSEAVMWHLGDRRQAVSFLWRDDASNDQALRNFLDVIWKHIAEPGGVHETERAVWLEVFDADTLRAWMSRPAVFEQAARIGLLKADPGLRDEVWRRVQAGQVASADLFRAAQLFRTPLPPLPQISAWSEVADFQSRIELWRWAFLVGDPEPVMALMDRSMTVRDASLVPVELIAPGLPCEGTPRAPPDCLTTRGRLAAALPILHRTAAAALSSSAPSDVAAALYVLGRLRYAPSRALLVEVARVPGPAQHEAQGVLYWSGHVTSSAQVGVLAQRELTSRTFQRFATMMDEEGAEQLVTWLLEQDTARLALVGAGALDELQTAAPGVCAPHTEKLATLVDDEAQTCSVRTAAARVLARCEPPWLRQLLRDNLLWACKGRMVDAVSAVSEIGTAEHLPILDELATDSRSRSLREEALRSARRIRAARHLPQTPGGQ